MSFGWGVRVDLPLKDLGRVSLPTRRIRFKDGYIRLGMDKPKTHVVAILVDKDDKVLPAPTLTEACVKSSLMGKALCYHLARFNKYQAGEAVGRREQIRVAVA